MGRDKLIGIALIAIILIGAFFLLKPNTTGQTTYSDFKEFDTSIKNFQYSPENINVNLGDKVKINIKNNDKVTHGISLPVFGVSEFVSPGQTKTIQFIASQKGNPETFCSSDHGEKLLINVN